MQVYDNVLSPTVLTFVKRKIFDGNFPWYYSRTSYSLEDTSNFGFSHMVVNESGKLSPLADILETVILTALDKADEKITELYRIRLGMLTRSFEMKANDPHIDADYLHKTGLIYLSNSNAPTRLYKEKYDRSLNMNSIDYYKSYLGGNVTQDADVECRENRLLCFDGMTYHSSMTPTDVDGRIVINFNYK